MKKINIFNRNINSPSYRRRGIPFPWERGPAEQPGGMGITPSPFGATPSWKEGERSGRGGLWFAALVALFIATPSFAEPTELDKKTVASKAYVDTKQDIIETGLLDYYSIADDETYQVPSLLSYGTGTNNADGILGNKIGILDWGYIGDDGWNNLTSSEMDNFVPTVRAVANSLAHLPWSNTQSTAINAYSTAFSSNGANNTWNGNSSYFIDGQFLANSLALKQNKITTDLVDYYSIVDEETTQVPSLVSYDSTNGLVGNEIGILDWYNTDNDGWYNLTSSEMDNFVPTVRAVAGGLERKQNILPAAWTGTASIYAMASTGGQTIELGTVDGLVNRRYITAGGSQPLTKKSGADNVILYINGTKTLAQYQTSNFGGTGDAATPGQNYIKGALVSLELLKDVYSELNAKITNALPAGTAGNVVTYSGTAGTVSSRGVYNDPTAAYYDHQNTNENELITVNAAGAIVDYVDARTPEITCAGVEPGTNECWLWTIPTYTTATRPLPFDAEVRYVWVTGYTNKTGCIAAIRQNTSITGLVDAKNAVENAPTRVATLGTSAASNLVSTLVSGGCTAEIRNP